ncbi:beta-ketoacyl-ACP synthase 3 [Mollicutes bacterium LVI A0078]|nr:beta-ketoacyl-ACP synthase 3 [Mollicutes bacterium LVI A0075]WOO91808.1 beta-ketoacyl-ACP synthase 3 [Mollicutes bacterium LVI A0078]
MRIEQIATYVPDNVVTNDDLSKVMDTSDEWIVKRTGIKSRNWTQESIEEMASKVLAKLDDNKFDAIIVTTMSNLNIAPSLSSMCAKTLGQTDCMCIDLNAACSGFVYGLNVAEGLLATGYQKVLLLSVEKMSSIIDKSDRSTAILFGDGAVATVLSSDGNDLVYKYNQTNNDNLSLTKFEGDYLKMDGQAVFKFATKTIGDCIDKYGSIDDIDYFVFHQANKRIIDNVVRKYKIDRSKVVMNLEHVANTSSSSIPLALSNVNLKSGDMVMMVGFGAGLSSGLVVYKH